MFSVDQIQSLLDVLKNQHLPFIGKHLGLDYLSKDEIEKLQSFGINPYHFYRPEFDNILMSFHFGLLSDAIGKQDAKQITYNDLKTYLESGQYIPLTDQERNVIDSIKRQTLSDIKGLEGRIFKDINNIIQKNEKDNRVAYENVIRDTILEGKEKRKTSKQIARDLAEKTGDWNRDFGRIVEYVSHQAFDEGRAAMYERDYGNDVLVYKDVYQGACKYCIKAYLTNGIGSEPIIYKLSTLKNNGTNIGRKVDELKPVIGNHHVNCRCTLNKYDESFMWNDKTKSFSIKKKDVQLKLKRERPKVKIVIRNKEYLV